MDVRERFKEVKFEWTTLEDKMASTALLSKDGVEMATDVVTPRCPGGDVTPDSMGLTMVGSWKAFVCVKSKVAVVVVEASN